MSRTDDSLNFSRKRSGRTWVFVICGLNILLVAFLMFRVFRSPESPKQIFPGQAVPSESMDESPEAASRRVREEAEIARSSEEQVEWVRVFSRHPPVASGQWTEESAQTLTVFLEILPEISDPLARLEAREMLFARFSGAPEAVEALIRNAEEVLDSAETSPAEKRSALVLLFRTLLQFPPEEDRPDSLDEISQVLQVTTSDLALRPILIEGWGVLRANGFDDSADSLFPAEKLRSLLESSGTDTDSLFQALRLAETLVPDWGSEHYRQWLDHEDSRIAGESWRQFQRTADASTLAWLEEWRPANPDLDLRRLKLIRILDQEQSSASFEEVATDDGRKSE